MTRRYHLAAVASAAVVVGLLAVSPARAADPVKLAGCLVQGDDHGFLLINGPREPALGTAAAPAATPGAIGTTDVAANIFYWLDKDDDLTPHIGHQVEVEGDLKGPLRDGEIRVDRKEQWTEVEVRSDGRKMKARVPSTSVVAGPASDRKIDVLVRRVDVSKVTMLDAVCR